MSFSIKDGSTWRTAKNVYINDGGTWRTAKCVYQNDSGTWRPAWRINTAMTVALNGGTNYGFLEALYGSVSPNTDVVGNTLYKLFYVNTNDNVHFEIRGSGMTYTQNDYVKELQIVGGGSIAMSDATSFINSGGTSVQWIWAGVGDVLGLVAANGTTVQVQARAA